MLKIPDKLPEFLRSSYTKPKLCTHCKQPLKPKDGPCPGCGLNVHFSGACSDVRMAPAWLTTLRSSAPVTSRLRLCAQCGSQIANNLSYLRQAGLLPDPQPDHDDSYAWSRIKERYIERLRNRRALWSEDNGLFRSAETMLPDDAAAAVQRVIELVNGRGWRVRLTKAADGGAYTNLALKEFMLPNIFNAPQAKDLDPNQRIDVLCGLALHESGHGRWTPAGINDEMQRLFYKRSGTSPTGTTATRLHICLNLVEDFHLEWMLRSLYPGFDAYLWAAMRWSYPKGLAAMQQLLSEPSAATAWTPRLAYTIWTCLEPRQLSTMQLTPPIEVRAIAEACRQELTSRLGRSQLALSQERCTAALAIYDLLNSGLKNAPVPPPQPGPGTGTPDDDSKGEPTNSNSPSKPGQGQGQSSPDTGQNEDAQNPPEPTKQPSSSSGGTEHDTTSQPGDAPPAADGTGHGDAAQDEPQPEPQPEPAAVDVAPATDDLSELAKEALHELATADQGVNDPHNHERDKSKRLEVSSLLLPIPPVTPALIATAQAHKARLRPLIERVRKYLQVRNLRPEQRTPGYRSGQLYRRALPRLLESNDTRLFAHKTVVSHPKARIGILIDESSSMMAYVGGSTLTRLDCARDVGLILAHAIQGIQGVKVWAGGFSHNTRMYLDPQHTIAAAMYVYPLMHGTYTGAGIHLFSEELLRGITPDEEAFVFVITDGEASGKPTVAQAIALHPRITFIEVGIPNSQETAYKYKIGPVTKPEDLTEGVIRTITQILIREK